MISETEIDNALAFLRDNADTAANAKAQRIYMEEYRKTVKALCMKKHEEAGVKSAAAQEREAYADPEYIEHIGAMKQAVFNDERIKYLCRAADAKVNAWQTQSANHRRGTNV